MTKMAILRTPILILVALLVLVSGCARLPNIDRTLLKPKSFGELEGYLLNHRADLDLFRLLGPFSVATQNNYQLHLSPTELIDADLYFSAHAEKAPLVIFLHGHGSSKESHTFQAMHVASWGLHSLALQLPSEGPWINNGKMLARIVNLIHRRAEGFDSRVDVSKIILVGHSFGGAAVAIALAEGAKAAGGILLDPAGVGRDLPNYLRRIRAPLLLLGADERVFTAIDRDFFFRFTRSGISEVSIKGAAHEDAQFPAGFALGTEELQITFASAITAASFSLSLNRKFDYAWASFDGDLRNGKLLNAKKK